MNRPEFDDVKSFAEFQKYYWYREELIKICKAHGLKAPSGKIELYKVIEAYFSGEKKYSRALFTEFRGEL